MSEIPTEPYKGVRDFYPSDWARLQEVFSVLRETMASWGYEEYIASPLERAELYEAKTSEEIVREQTYTFTDRGDRRVTMRPEMTPTLARMVAARRRELSLPLRWFSIPNVFRYERPQKGRLREHYQLNVDLIGIEDIAADREVISIAHALLTALGATNKDFVIRVNSRALLEKASRASGLSKDETRAYLRLLDKGNKITVDEFKAALGALSSADPIELISDDDEHIKEEKSELTALIDELHSRGMENVVFDPHIVRGFDYYTGIVFEIFDTNPENPRSIFGGGRYDNLIGAFGGDDIPATGFGMGDVTLMDFLVTHKLLPEPAHAPEMYLGTPRKEDRDAAEEAAILLRKQGLRVFVNLTEKPLGDQVKDAAKRGIPFFAAIGEDERHSKTLRVKELSSGKEVQLSLFDIASHVKRG